MQHLNPAELRPSGLLDRQAIYNKYSFIYTKTTVFSVSPCETSSFEVRAEYKSVFKECKVVLEET